MLEHNDKVWPIPEMLPELEESYGHTSFCVVTLQGLQRHTERPTTGPVLPQESDQVLLVGSLLSYAIIPPYCNQLLQVRFLAELL
jgi:hypothetical protein